MKINENLINAFDSMQRELPTIIEAFGLSKVYIAHSAGMNRQTFYRKMKNRTFTAEELLKVAKVINK